MSHTLELAAITHGTVDGYRAGCHGSRNSCGAAISCAEAYTRYQGDWGFRKRINAGENPADIITAELAELEAVRARDKAATAAAKRAANTAHQQREQRVRARKTGQQTPRPPRPALIPSKGTLIRDDVARLHDEELTDVAIAAELHVSAHLVGQVRRDLGLPRIIKTQQTPASSARALRAEKVRELHAEGKTDRQIAEVIGVTAPAANQIRRRLRLPVNREDRTRWAASVTSRVDRRPEITRLHGEGMTDAAIATELGISKNRVGELRRDLGLKANGTHHSKWDGVELSGHGTNASYARGCRCEPCTTARREYHRDYTKRRRAEGAGEHHGTAYGYQLGCRARSECPADTTCTDAMLDAERARRRTAGIPAKNLVDAAPARAHVQELRAAGMPTQHIANAASVPWATVKSLLFSRGAGRPPVESLLSERAAAILAVPIPEEKAA